MAKNLKKFVNPRFTRTVDPELIVRLLERHRTCCAGSTWTRCAATRTRHARRCRRSSPDRRRHYPEGLIADLHRIAELGDACGLRLLLDQAARLGVGIAPERDGGERRQDPKHVALRVFLDHPAVFDAASDMLALIARSSLAEFAGLRGGCRGRPERRARGPLSKPPRRRCSRSTTAAATAASAGTTTPTTVNLVVTHGSIVRTTPILRGGEERVISYRAAEQAVLSYSAATGRMKIGGGTQLRRSGAGRALRRQDARSVRASSPVRTRRTSTPWRRSSASGAGFAFNHAFDRAIRRGADRRGAGRPAEP